MGAWEARTHRGVRVRAFRALWVALRPPGGRQGCKPAGVAFVRPFVRVHGPRACAYGPRTRRGRGRGRTPLMSPRQERETGREGCDTDG